VDHLVEEIRARLIRRLENERDFQAGLIFGFADPAPDPKLVPGLICAIEEVNRVFRIWEHECISRISHAQIAVAKERTA
jgi:hypothetical protein